jgi:hypothetical protein
MVTMRNEISNYAGTLMRRIFLLGHGLALASPAALPAQEVEIINGVSRARSQNDGPGIRVIAYVQFEIDETEHRVVTPLLPEEVLRVQEALSAAGYEPGPEDGVYGPAVESALRAFQADRRLTPCGCFDYATAMALGFKSRVIQTVIGAAADDAAADVVLGNVRLPPPPAPERTTVPPETLVVVQQVNNNWLGYPVFWSGLPPVVPAPRYPPGFPLGGPRRLGARPPGGSPR